MKKLLLLAFLLAATVSQAATTFKIPATYDSLMASVAGWEDNLNGGAVTVITDTDVIDTPVSLTVEAGDWLAVSWHTHLTKGATGGLTMCRLYQSAGTGVLDWLLSSSSHFGTQWVDQAASSMVVLYDYYMIRVETGGTVTVELQCTSGGSNGTVANGGAAIFVRVLR